VRDDRSKIPEIQPLSKALQHAARFAAEAGALEFERWLRIELGGYYGSNSAMSPDVVVPEYRTVSGVHFDIFGRRLIVPTDLSFVNETRLRNGVEELESLASGRETIAVHDPTMCELIQQHLKVEVYSFHFSAAHLMGVLAAIRNEFESKFQRVAPVKSDVSSTAEPKSLDILELRPNLYGIGIDLRALWRKWTARNDAE
jgi:hypothetical protein